VWKGGQETVAERGIPHDVVDRDRKLTLGARRRNQKRIAELIRDCQIP